MFYFLYFYIQFSIFPIFFLISTENSNQFITENGITFSINGYNNNENGLFSYPVTHSAMAAVMTREEVKIIMNLKANEYQFIQDSFFVAVSHFNSKSLNSNFYESFDILKNISSRAINFLIKLLKNQRKKINQNLMSDAIMELENKFDKMILKNENMKNNEKTNSTALDAVDKLKSLSNKLNTHKNILPAIARKNILYNCKLLWQVRNSLKK